MSGQNILFSLESYFPELGGVRRKYKFAGASFWESFNQVAQKSGIFGVTFLGSLVVVSGKKKEKIQCPKYNLN